jgi:hypothetical protein
MKKKKGARGRAGEREGAPLLIRSIDTVFISVAYSLLADASGIVCASVSEACITSDAVVAAAELVTAGRAVRLAIALL